ncbi:hypothetical protein [Paraburkholderia sp. J8-2]|uniref:hypothetical protein n=1 Tax=Paraburkholderia sp. J8-2 TaxID=2805440 RepID=UPI002AB7EE53|nr:hypothetical protein [Paraburkholderia sp. J8-2]
MTTTIEAKSAGLVPADVKWNLEFALSRLREEEAALTNIQRARGTGFILSLELRDRSPMIEKSTKVLDEFRELAPRNGVCPESYLESLGGVPDFGRFGKPAAIGVQATGGLQPRPVGADQ